MIANKENYRAGMLAETWADYEATIISPDVPTWIRRDMRQSFVAGVAAFVIAQNAATATANTAKDFERMLDEIEAEALEMSKAIDAEAEFCDCPGCRAERAARMLN